jgi:hypothetical protein
VILDVPNSQQIDRSCIPLVRSRFESSCNSAIYAAITFKSFFQSSFFRKHARSFPTRCLALATIARCFARLVAILLNTAARIGSIFIALHDASTKTYRKRLAPWRVICPRYVFSPEDYSLGVKLVRQKRERSRRKWPDAWRTAVRCFFFIIALCLFSKFFVDCFNFLIESFPNGCYRLGATICAPFHSTRKWDLKWKACSSAKSNTLRIRTWTL